MEKLALGLSLISLLYLLFLLAEAWWWLGPETGLLNVRLFLDTWLVKSAQNALRGIRAKCRYIESHISNQFEKKREDKQWIINSEKRFSS